MTKESLIFGKGIIVSFMAKASSGTRGALDELKRTFEKASAVSFSASLPCHAPRAHTLAADPLVDPVVSP